MVDFKEILRYIVHTDNTVIFHTYQIHGKELYTYDEEKGWQLNVTDEKIIALLFDMVKNLNEERKLLWEQITKLYALQPINIYKEK